MHNPILAPLAMDFEKVGVLAKMALESATDDTRLPALSSPEGLVPQPNEPPSPRPGSPTTAAAEFQAVEGAKRRKACEGCRRLKVQCHFESSHNEACKRCTKAGRQCIVSERRRRQVTTPTTVSELEKKLATLTASLDAFKSGPPARGITGNVSADDSTTTSSDLVQERRDSLMRQADNSPDVGSIHHETGHLPSGKLGHAEIHGQRLPPSQGYLKDHLDVIDRGLLPLDTAFSAFDHFVTDLVPHFPIVVFPEGSTAASVRRETPIIFLAGVHAASGILSLEIQRELSDDIMKLFANRILVVGEKSLELIQAVQIVSVWYYPPGRYEELKYYQIIHSACIMAIDIGLNRRGKAIGSIGLNEATRERSSKRPDPSTVISRRAWLGCYFLAAQTAQNLRRDNLIKWSSYMDECLKVLEISPDASSSDEIFCQWIRLQHIADDVGTQFSIEDPAACPGLDDPKMRFAIKGLEGQLRACTAYPLKMQKPVTLKLGELVTRLYMHEVALHAGYGNDDMQPPFTEEALKSIRPTQAANLSVGHISSLSTCLSVIHTLFDTFISNGADQVRNLPTFHFVRVIYAGVVLTKMAYDATVPDSEMQRMFSPDDFKFDYYLSALVALLKTAAEGNRCASAAKFAMVLFVVKALFHRQTSQKEVYGGNDSSGTSRTPLEGRDGQLFTRSSRQHAASSIQWQNHDHYHELAIDPHSNSVGNFDRQNLHLSNVPQSQSESTPLHLFIDGASGEHLTNDSNGSNGQSIDHLMNDTYEFDSEGFLVNGADFPAIFSHDGLLSSVLQISPSGFFDYGVDGPST